MIVDKVQKLTIIGLGTATVILLALLVLMGRDLRKVEKEYNQYKTSVEKQRQIDTKTLSDLREANAQALNKQKREAEEALAKHIGELNDLQVKYNNELLANDRMRIAKDSVLAKWDSYDYATQSNYTRAAADGLEECIGFTTEVVKIAYDYNSELEYLRSIFPKMNIDGTMTVYDPKTGAHKVYGSPVEVKADLADIRELPPDTASSEPNVN